MTADITQGLRRAAQVNPGGIATIQGERQRSWADVAARVPRLAGGIKALGVAEGDRVAILALNCDRYLEYYFAVLWAGAVALPLNTRLAAPEIARILADGAPKILFVDDAMRPLLDDLGPALAGIEAVIHMGEEPTPDGMMSYEALIQENDPIQRSGRRGDDLAGLYYTGGSTGKPKGVMLSHNNLASNAANAIYLVGLRQDSVYIHAAPMFHATDGMATFSLTELGGCHVFMPRFDPGACLDLMARHRVTEMILVPTMIGMLLDHPDLDRFDLSALKQIVFGSSPMPEGILKKAIARWPQVKLAHGWGMTEVTTIGTMQPPHCRVPAEIGDLIKSCGQAAPNLEVLIADGEGQEVARGEVGEIIIRGPSIMLGYWNMPAETAAALKDGWLHTGDMAYMDDTGFVYIVDRLKDMIISGGENVYSTEVESVLSLMPGVAQVAVIGIPHEHWGEAVHAVITPQEGASITLDDIRAFCRGKLAGYKIPRSLEIREGGLPLSGAGKVLKTELRAAYWETAKGK